MLTGVTFKGRARLNACDRGTSAPDQGRRREEGAKTPDDRPERRQPRVLSPLHPPRTSLECRSNRLHGETLDSYRSFFHTLRYSAALELMILSCNTSPLPIPHTEIDQSCQHLPARANDQKSATPQGQTKREAFRRGLKAQS